MTDEQSFDEDPQLRVLLTQADPAPSLTPADPEGLARLLEDTMTHDLDTRPELEQTTDLRRRGPLAWLVAAAAVAVIAGGGYAAVSSMQDNGTAPQAGQNTAPGEPAADPVVMTLQAPSAVQGKCAVPTPELLGSAEVAFAGTVTAIDGDTVTLTPTETYAGESAEEVEVVGLRPDLRAVGGQPEFVVGGTYLVSAVDGQISACGFSGAATPQLEQLYDVAFG